MNKTSRSPSFSVRSVHALDQHYDLLDIVEDGLESHGDDRPIGFLWDWNVLDDDTVSVMLGMQLGATEEVPERVRYAVGAIVAFNETPPIEPTFLELVRIHIPAILFPYVREGVSALTSRAVSGTFVAPPMNLYELSKEFDMHGSTGFRRLQKEPRLRARFGVSLEEDPDSTS